MLIKIDAGTAGKSVIGQKTAAQKEKDLAKKDTENAFSGLSEIAQDFYGDRTTEMFHGITEDYVDE